MKNLKQILVLLIVVATFFSASVFASSFSYYLYDANWTGFNVACELSLFGNNVQVGGFHGIDFVSNVDTSNNVSGTPVYYTSGTETYDLSSFASTIGYSGIFFVYGTNIPSGSCSGVPGGGFFSVNSGTYTWLGGIESAGLSQIYTISPNHDTVVATTSDMVVDGYVSPEDYNNGYNKVNLVFDSLNGGDSITYEETLAHAGSFNVSTSTTFNMFGRYQFTATVRNIFVLSTGSFGNYNQVRMSSTFIVSSPTQLDIYSSSTDAYATSLYSASSTALTDSSSCSPFSLVLDKCIKLLFVPSSLQISGLYNLVETGVAQVIPFGYITRSIVILGDTATETPPLISADFSSHEFDNNPILHSLGLVSFSFWTSLNSWKDWQTPYYHLNVWDIMGTFYRYLVGFGVLYYIYERLGFVLSSRVNKDKKVS